MLILIDFEKAFDSIAWKFIYQTLDFFNFGPSLKKWIETFYNGIKSCIIQNGVLSDCIFPQRGCRQGDPISPYLFLLCAEILGILIRNNQDIKGITIEGEEYKLSQYADDTSLISDGSPKSMDGILRELDYFANISGLKINFSKTKMIWIGSKKFSKEVFHHSRWKLDWNNSKFDLLGITFSVNLKEMLELNYTTKLEDIRKIINKWSMRKLSPIGRLTIIKTLIIPKLNHLILTLPNPKPEYIKMFETEMYHFLWNSKTHRIKKNTIIQDYRYGGLKMIDYTDFISALKSSWIRRLIHSNASWVKLLESELKIDIKNLWLRGSDYILYLSKEITNAFWKEVLDNWIRLTNINKESKLVLSEHVWNNPHIQVNNESFFLEEIF